MTLEPDEQERVARKILSLVDLSRDLERNFDDSSFAKNGGEIIYVVDENIFEMFLRPHRHHEAVETFYGEVWGSGGSADPSWRRFETQAAMIAAEFLLSGALPGARDGVVYVTEPHRWELADRLEVVTGELRGQIEQDRSRVAEELRRKLAVFSPGEVDKETRSSLADATLAGDMAKLAAAQTPPALLEQMRLARGAAAVLAASELTEPLDQLRRLVSQPLRRQVHSLQVEFRPSERDVKAIEEEAAGWFALLVEELKQVGHQSRQRAKREEAGRSLWNDARSIAYLRWVSRRLSANQRLVFVTGDPVLFDAYRRWHSNPEAKPGSSTKPSPSNEPFFMRRAVQFSPIFNPNDIGGDLSRGLDGASERAVLFSLIQQAVEATLVSFSLVQAQAVANASDGVFSRHRERLALKLVEHVRVLSDPELSTLRQLIQSDRVAEQGQKLDEIRDNWQELHRLAIGASYELIMPRMNEKEIRALAPAINAAAHDNGAALQAYAAEIIDKIVNESLHFFLPLAETIIAGGAASGHPQRWPKRLNLALQLDDESLRGQLGPTQRNLPPEMIFAIAAKRSLELQDVNNAERFSSLAVRADDSARIRDGGLPGFASELRYLSAVAQRYLIATVREHLVGNASGEPDALAIMRSIDQVKLTYGRSAQQIHACLSTHFSWNDRPTAEDAKGHRMRYVRALSERAALNLFMATSLGLSEPLAGDQIQSDALAYLDLARGDLKLAVDEMDRIGEADPMLEAVSEQLIPNIAAAEVLRCLLIRGEDYRFDTSTRAQQRAIGRFAMAQKTPHPLLAAELEAFFFLAGWQPTDFRPWGENERMNAQVAKVRLPLDRTLLKRIRSEII